MTKVSLLSASLQLTLAGWGREWIMLKPFSFNVLNTPFMSQYTNWRAATRLSLMNRDFSCLHFSKLFMIMLVIMLKNIRGRRGQKKFTFAGAFRHSIVGWTSLIAFPFVMKGPNSARSNFSVSVTSGSNLALKWWALRNVRNPWNYT